MEAGEGSDAVREDEEKVAGDLLCRAPALLLAEHVYCGRHNDRKWFANHVLNFKSRPLWVH